MPYSHKDLVRNPSLLINDLFPETQKEDDLNCARVGSVLDDDYSCITTSSCDYIPSPALGGARAVHERSDFLFADDDYLVWPQPYQPSLPHLPFIHRRDLDVTQPNRTFLWSLPERSDFNLYDSQSCSGLGKLSGHRRMVFETFWQPLKMNAAGLRVLPEGERQLLNELCAEVQPLLDRLQYLDTGFRVVCRTVRALQRTLLEIEAFLQYRSCTTDMQKTATRTIGAFVYNIHDLTRLKAWGVDHWLIRPYTEVLRCRVASVVAMEHPEQRGLSVDRIPHVEPIFVGAVSDPALYRAIVDYGRNCLRFPDPFHAHALPEPLPSSIGPLRSSKTGQRALTQQQRKKKMASDRAQGKRFVDVPRSKFEDPTCEYYPPGIPAWQTALLDVDTSKELFVFEASPSDSGYVVPEPAFLVSTKSAEKSQFHFRSWLKYRPILIFRLSTSRSLAKPKHGKAWSALLAAEYATIHAKNATPSTKETERLRLREEMISFLGISAVAGSSSEEVQVPETVGLSTEGCSWHGIAFEKLQREHFEQILWELAEINFRFEFQALDRRARRGTPYERLPNAELALMECVPDRSFAVPCLPIANHGIASTSPRERAHYLFAMARVMSRWRWTDRKSLISKVNEQLRWSLAEVEALEAEIATVYTQTFHNCFRRAPIIPRRLSHQAVAASPLIGRTHEPTLVPIIENNSTIMVNLKASV